LGCQAQTHGLKRGGSAGQRRWNKVEPMENHPLVDACVQDEELLAHASLALPDSTRAALYSLVALELQRRFERTGSMDDLNRAITTKEQAVAIHAAPRSIRILAAVRASELLIGHDWNRANTILRTAVELLPTTSPHTLNELDRQYQIAPFAGITSLAVSVSLQCGENPYRALELSEVGNGVLETLQLQVRSDITVLEESLPEIAQQFYDLRDQLDRPGDHIDPLKPVPLRSALNPQNRHTVSNDFNRLLANIRQRKGFEDFLLAPSEAQLKKLAAFGPIVVFNVSDIRSDALIISLDHIRTVPIPLLKSSDLERYANRFLKAIHTVGLKD